jgi:hypothetical protein
MIPGGKAQKAYRSEKVAVLPLKSCNGIAAKPKGLVLVGDHNGMGHRLKHRILQVKKAAITIWVDREQTDMILIRHSLNLATEALPGRGLRRG